MGEKTKKDKLRDCQFVLFGYFKKIGVELL